MAPRCTVVIGAPELLEALGSAVESGVSRTSDDASEILGFSDRDVPGALETIASRRPHVIALERLFAATSRGAALINRLKADPSLASVEIRILAHDGSHSRVSPRRTPASTAGPAASDYRVTRRAPRFKMIEGTEARVDGARARIIDLSASGAQIETSLALRLRQRVRIALSDEAGVIRFDAAVAWASFEMKTSTPGYRAGVAFTDARGAAVDAFCARHRRL
jgi:hypothetical protein